MLVVLKEVGCCTQFSIIVLSDDVAPSAQRSDTCLQTENKIYQYFNEGKAHTAHMIIDCDLNMQLTNLSDVCGKLHSVNTSLQGGGDEVLQLKNNFKLFIREVEL